MFQPLPVFVGLRYSLARENTFFVSFITWVSLLGVAVGRDLSLGSVAMSRRMDIRIHFIYNI